MRWRHGWLACWLACAGCHVLNGVLPVGEPDPAQTLWQRGQTALGAGQHGQAIGLYEQSLAADPNHTRNHLSLAAAYLEVGNPSAACAQLAKYLTHHPAHTTVRAQYAELLLRLGQEAEARVEFARFADETQDVPDADMRRRIHAHGRLMEIAETVQDLYDVHLHRGIGLFLLGCSRAELNEPEGELPAEGLLCKAAGELSLAHELRPEAARPCWYLHLTWNRLGQHQPASRWLRQTAEANGHGALTAAEQRSLQLALRRYDRPLSAR